MNTRMRHRRMRRKKPKRFTRGMKFGLLGVLGVCFLLFCGLLYNICDITGIRETIIRKKCCHSSHTSSGIELPPWCDQRPK